MAAIDKTYISDWETFDKIRNWAREQNITLKNGKVVNLSSYMYNPDLTKGEWDEWKDNYEKKHPKWVFEAPIWSTPKYVDVWLIRNCPFDVIQERLKEQYGGGWSKEAFTEHNDEDMYEQIKNGTSVYDTFERNGLGDNAKVSFRTTFGKPFRDRHCWWWISIDSPWGFWYNDDDDMWYHDDELMPISSNVCTNKRGPLTKKNVLKLVRKWNLPKGTKLRFDNIYQEGRVRSMVHRFYVTVK